MGIGGGVYCDGRSTPTFENCAISGNAGSDELWPVRFTLGGGGVVCGSESSPTFRNCTISSNSADFAGGVYCEGTSTPTLTNCIVWGNVGGAVATEGSSSPQVTYSCIEGENLWPGTGNINSDPLFVQPGAWEVCDPASGSDCVPYEWDDDGNPTAWHRWTFDYRLQAGSPCIDAGRLAGAPTTDIEGNGRPCGAGVDMGAYEMGGCPAGLRFIRGDSNSDGKLNVADPIHTLLYAFAAGDAPACLDTADSNDDGAITVADAIFVLQYLFVEGPVIPPPSTDCGIDPTVDGLGCASYESCHER